MSENSIRSTSATRRLTTRRGAGRQKPDDFSSYEALVRKLFSSIDSGPQEESRVIGVTSCGRGEGVSTVVANVGGCAVNVLNKRVLIIDGNSANPAMDQVFGTDPFPGLWEYVFDEAPLDSCVHPTDIEDLSIMPAGNTNGRNGRMLLRNKCDGLLQFVKGQFGLVLLDLPPIANLDVCQILAEMSDGILIVVESESVRLPVAQNAQQQLSNTNIRVLGAVLNKRRNYVPDWLYRRL